MRTENCSTGIVPFGPLLAVQLSLFFPPLGSRISQQTHRGQESNIEEKEVSTLFLQIINRNRNNVYIGRWLL